MQDQPFLRGGTLLITGSNGGLGTGLVEYLLARGIKRVACHYRSSNERVAETLSSHGFDPRLHCFKAELTSEGDVKKLKSEIEQSLGPVSGIVNLAGATGSRMMWNISVDEFKSVVDSNLLSTFLCCREFAPSLRQMQWGRIVNISSIVAFRGTIGSVPYCAAKAGILGMTRAMALELSSKGITANTVVLGYFDAGMIKDVPPDVQESLKEITPVRRFGRVDEFGALITYLLSEQASFTTGNIFHLNGGLYA